MMHATLKKSGSKNGLNKQDQNFQLVPFYSYILNTVSFKSING